MTGLDRAKLKYIAMFSMLADHIAACVIIHQNNPALYYVMRGIGRLGMPIFCMLLVDGFNHTHDRGAYAWRLFLFAVLSEIPYDLAFSGKPLDFASNNAMWTLLFGFLFMFAVEKALGFFMEKHKGEMLYALWFLSAEIFAVIAAFTCYAIHSDYAHIGVIFIVCLYFIGKINNKYIKIFLLSMAMLFFSANTHWPAIFALPFLLLYNGNKGRKAGGYIWYWFYPVHLLACYLVGLLFVH